MSKRWLAFGSLPFLAAIVISLNGCSAPPNIMDAPPPGIDARQSFQPKDTSEAEALGEMVAKTGANPKMEVTPTLPPAEPTAKGETKKTPSGVVYETIKEGTGPTAKFGQTILIHYTGKLENGKQFDTSRKNGGRPYKTGIGNGNVIAGWNEAVPGMKVGEQRKLTIPPEAGYGAQGFPPDIPPNATLLFDVELMEVIGEKNEAAPAKKE